MARPSSLALMVVSALALSCAGAAAPTPPGKPNFVVIFCDDLGYGDLGCFGNGKIRTPNLDRMAQEGQRWTDFYVAASVCTPSRAGLMTGRLPIRSGMCSSRRRVLFPNSKGGLPASEVTIAEGLKQAGYATGCFGKWHLGHLPQFLPTRHGFDVYFGIPYSNDMDRVADRKLGRKVFQQPKVEYWNCPLLRNETVVERPADQRTITKRYTEEAIKFIKANRKGPFFVYLPHSMPHVPLFRSEAFAGRNKARGMYGDVIEEIDWSVGQVLDTLRSEGLAENTLVVFTSDNGPWLIFGDHGGTAGPLREGKGCTFDGGMREPTVFWWPGRLKQGTVRQMGSTLDLLPTFLSIAGAKAPGDRILDGYDLSPVLFGTGPSPRHEMYFYRGAKLYAVRKDDFKAHLFTKPAYGRGKEKAHDPPLLFNLRKDIGEKTDVAAQHKGVVAEIKRMAEEHQKTVKPVVNQLELR